MHTMAPAEWRAFLEAGTRTAKLSVVRADGSPHGAPVWFVLDRDDLVFMTGRDTLKGRCLRRDGRVALCVDDEAPPFAFVLIRGRARLSEDLAEMLPLSIRIAARYMGPALADEFGHRNAVPGEMLVRVPLDDVLAQAEIAD
ncbi:MAG: PPOX class F420-dependent oxidoreductase [Chloroflexi bacterium]|nr:PPOX class F420-dependent oxidoreductase [Chloroflexota bacterium]